MLVAVVSDTHGNRAGMERLARFLREAQISTLLHLGDDYGDLAFFSQQGFEAIGVPGVYCPQYQDPRIPNRLVLELSGVKLLLTHTDSRHRYDRPEDPDPRAAAWEVDLVLYGHSHVPALEDRESGWWLNPGHLKNPVDRGSPATFALLDLDPKGVWVQIRRLADGGIILERELPLSREGQPHPASSTADPDPSEP